MAVGVRVVPFFGAEECAGTNAVDEECEPFVHVIDVRSGDVDESCDGG